MTRFLLLLALLPSLALSQSLSRPGVPASGGTIDSYYLFRDNAFTVCHAYWDGTELRDTKGCAWTMTGTVPQVARSGVVPPSAGPFATGDHYRLGTTTDALDFPGEFYMCFVAAPQTTGSSYLFGDGTVNVAGYYLSITSGFAVQFIQNASGADASVSVTGFGVSPQSVICAGMDGANIAAQVDLGTYTTATRVTPTAGTGIAARLGLASSGSIPHQGYMQEAIWYQESPSSIKFDTAVRRAIQKLGGYTIAGLGDSITNGYTPLLKAAFSTVPCAVRNYGVSGNTTAMMLTRWYSTILAEKWPIVVVLGGTNDATGSAVDPAVTIANLTQIYTSAIAAGSMVLPITIPPFGGHTGWTQAREDRRLAVNTWIRGYGLAYVDADALGDGATPPVLQTAYDSGDHIHPSAAGYTALNVLIRAKVP